MGGKARTLGPASLRPFPLGLRNKSEREQGKKMKRFFVTMATVVLAILIIQGCSQSPQAPAPTQPAAAPTKAGAPATAVPSSPPAKAAYPKGQPITVIVPYSAGGATDIATRLLATLMEKDLGSPVQVVNKPGAGSQVGVTELSTAKPDGLVIGITAFPAVITTYLDPQRKAVFSRKSFEPIGAFMDNPVVSSVAAGSPYKSMKEVVDAAKSSPGKIRAGTTGILGPSHLGLLQLQKETGIQLAPVHFDGGAPQMTALLGGHIDLASNIVPEVVSAVKSGQIRPLAIMDKAESKYLSGVPTFTAQGLSVVSTSPVGLSAPAGTPKEIVDVLAASLKKATESADFKGKMDELGYTTLVPDPASFATLWDQSETQIKPLMELASKEQPAK